MKKWQFIEAKFMKESMEKAPFDGKHQLEPLASLSKEKGIPCNILEDHNFFQGQPEVHRHEADLWIVLAGEFTFLVGGEMVQPYAKEGNDNEIKSKEIKGATEVILRSGDTLFIPAGVPHSHTAKHGRASIIKIPEHDVVPLKEVPGWQK